MTELKYAGLDTLALHAGAQPDPATGARATPIYQTASFVFPDSDYAASLFNLERSGHVYSRISNPTNAVLEERIAALEGGVGAIATASGQAALLLAITTLMGAGSHIVAASSLYGGSHNLLTYTLPRFGIETTFVDSRDPQAFAAAIRDNTRLVFAETIGNPGLDVLDIPAVAAVAHAAQLPLLVDSTFTTPYLVQPLELGADLIDLVSRLQPGPQCTCGIQLDGCAVHGHGGRGNAPDTGAIAGAIEQCLGGNLPAALHQTGVMQANLDRHAGAGGIIRRRVYLQGYRIAVGIRVGLHVHLF